MAPAVLVIDATPRGPRLDRLLGGERVAALDRLLSARASAWAAQVAPGHVSFAPEDRVAAAVEALFAADAGPVLVAWPDLLQWRADHAGGALGDLRDGCDVSLGPVFDGGFYLMAMARPVPALLTLAGDARHVPDALGVAIGAVNEAGLEVGMLRAERGVRSAADVRAALVDPLLDDEARTILAG